jgi:hypothetical protein
MSTKHPQFETVRDFIAHVGRDRFQTATGYSTQLVTRALSTGLMPSGWYLNVRSFCNTLGVMVPEHLFRWDQKQSSKQYANCLQKTQVKNSIPSEKGCEAAQSSPQSGGGA